VSSPVADRVRRLLRPVPDFPRQGITFQDITPVLADPAVLAASFEALAASVPGTGGGADGGAGRGIDLVAGVEARGFLLGTPLALALGAGFVPVRKAGKLPWRTVVEHYDLEYGRAAVEVHEDAVRPGQRVLVVDDVLATGGTARAACALVERLGGEVVGLRFLVELTGLGGAQALAGRDAAALVAV
jgi:adenine phosphoribosyltransferase